MAKRSNTARRLTVSIALIVVLALCLGVTSFALIWSMVEVKDNVFVTGTVDINLNDGKPVIEMHEFLFEPGMTVEKEFFLRNDSTCQVYYRLYFQNVSGGLADYLQITIYDGDKVLYSGTPGTLQKADVTAANDTLAMGETRNLKIRFHFPSHIGNEAQGLSMHFDMAAQAVQTKNNPNKLFD